LGSASPLKTRLSGANSAIGASLHYVLLNIFCQMVPILLYKMLRFNGIVGTLIISKTRSFLSEVG